MSTLTYKTTTKSIPNRACFRSPEELGKYAISVTIDLTNTILADADSEALYIPDDYLPVGTLLALATAGPAYAGLWVPYLPNIAVANGEDVCKAVLFEPAYIVRDAKGTVDHATVIGSAIPVNSPAQVFGSKLPQYNDFTAYAGGAGSSAAVAQADLPTGFQDLEDLAITGFAGI